MATVHDPPADRRVNQMQIQRDWLLKRVVGGARGQTSEVLPNISALRSVRCLPEIQDQLSEMEVNFLFLKSRRSVLKILEMVVAFVVFVSFAASSSSGAFLAVPLMEIFITLAFYVLYLLKLDSKITFLFWPLMDSMNSAFAAAFLLIICIVALALRTTAGIITGSVSVCGHRGYYHLPE
ncbi:uncharacterized protein [Hemitrygon akajei]|uniref:uncharacterized protein n=1 Tax=Hemitrygon akajei TaxID=2704970 RepID=UPI003BF9E7D1